MNIFPCRDTGKPTYPSKCKRECTQAPKCRDYRKASHTGYFSKRRIEPKGKKTRISTDYNGITVIHPVDINPEQLVQICAEEVANWKIQRREISKIEITVDGEELVIHTREKSPIKRVRRITGYLSELTNFNESKKAEAAAREVHVRGGGE